MKNFILILIFIILNTLLLPIITTKYFILFFGASIMKENPYEEFKICFLIIILFFYMRVFVLPIFYLLLKNKKTIFNNFFNLIKKNIMFNILLLSFFIFVDFISLYIYCNYFLLSEMKLTLIDYIKYIFSLGYCFSGYGLFFAYLSLLFYTRIIEEKFKQRGFFNIIICLLFLIMFLPINIILLDIFI